MSEKIKKILSALEKEISNAESKPGLSDTRRGVINLGQELFDIVYSIPDYKNIEIPAIKFTVRGIQYKLQIFTTEDPKRDWYVVEKNDKEYAYIEVSEVRFVIHGECFDLINDFYRAFNDIKLCLQSYVDAKVEKDLNNSMFCVTNTEQVKKVNYLLSKFNKEIGTFGNSSFVVVFKDGNVEYHPMKDFEKLKKEFKFFEL